jgi:hypothetical protein
MKNNKKKHPKCKSSSESGKKKLTCGKTVAANDLIGHFVVALLQRKPRAGVKNAVVLEERPGLRQIRDHNDHHQ